MIHLDQRIAVQAASTEQDDTGQPLDAWTDFALLWANIKHQSGISAIRSGMDTSTVKASIRIRHTAGIHAGMRVLHDGTHYNIQSVALHADKKYIDLIAVAVNAHS